MPIYEIQEAETKKAGHKSADNLNPLLKNVRQPENTDIELKHTYYAEMLSPFIIKVSNHVITES